MSDKFEQLGLATPLCTALASTGISVPTTIQAAVIPVALAGQDIIGQSPTGSGKTLAYLLPLLQKIDTARRETQAFILAPTHELAIQIQRQIELVAAHSGLPVTSTPIIGDVNIVRQIDKLKEKPHIITGSSGRILEMVQKKKINSQTVKTIILDEADRLLDDKNAVSVKAVIKTTQKDRQLLAFSATMPPLALAQARELMQSAVEILPAGQETENKPDIDHVYFVSDRRDKFETLRKIVRSLAIGQALVFVNKSDEVELTVDKLKYHRIKTAGLHGRFVKEERQKAMDGFRNGSIQLLVASDLAARGLDIPGVKFIVNLDLPEDAQVYLHRSGRTGRAGNSGMAISIVSPQETAHIARYEKALGIKIRPQHITHGRVFDKRVAHNRGDSSNRY